MIFKYSILCSTSYGKKFIGTSNCANVHNNNRSNAILNRAENIGLGYKHFSLIILLSIFIVEKSINNRKDFENSQKSEY